MADKPANLGHDTPVQVKTDEGSPESPVLPDADHGKSDMPAHEKSDLAAKPSLGGFLESFGGKSSADGDKQTNVVLSNEELERQYLPLADGLEDAREKLHKLRSRIAARQVPDDQELKKAATEQERVEAHLNKELVSFEKAVANARKARQDDPVPQWLTGELLILVGGEPEQILPYLQQAVNKGLNQPRLWSSLSRAQLEANHFGQAYDSALKGLDGSPQDHYIWNAFTRAAFSIEKFATVLERLDRAFPEKAPDWTVEMRSDAVDLLAKWQTEQQTRKADQQANNLPRVRLTIEHRRFARAPDGSRLTSIENTGRDEVTIELFEDQAPATVANFIDLSSRGFYDETRFHMAESASVVAGGDPNSRNKDPMDDGVGGPGYAIPDEFKSPQARGHFRGSVSMVNTGPHTAGSQFFITLVPKPEMNGHFTVFGRVIEGQEAVDRITLGRTTPLIGHFGKVVPGDLIVHAEVIRKRPHEYTVIKTPSAPGR